MDIAKKIFILNKELEFNHSSACVVEGIRDKRVLEKLGFKNIFDISGKSLYTMTQNISKYFRSAIILADFDEEGETIAGYLRKNLQANGVYVNLSLRSKLRALGIKTIEELAPIAKFKAMYDDGNASLVDKEAKKIKFSAKRRIGQRRNES